jgi:glycosyltransferase involved in cell wall biosynthesis
MKKLLIITPHLSTGGAPQVTVNKVELLKDEFEIKVIEYSFLAWQFVVQRNRIIKLVGQENFHSLGENKHDELMQIMQEFKPDVISMEEFPEMFMDDEVTSKLYCRELFGGTYKIIETTHDSSFNPAHKKWMPDKFVFVSPYNMMKYDHLDIPQEVIEYPINSKVQDKRTYREKLGLEHNFKHLVIIGLFTPRKNQKYAFEIAEILKDYNIKFHFLGNQAGNFEHYWKPLMDKKPENCVIWGERADTEEFIQASDLFFFPSKGDRGNKELNPIVIKEAAEYKELPKLIFNLDVYLNRWNNYEDFHYLTGNLKEDAQKILELTQAKPSNNKREMIIVGTWPNLKSRVQLTKDTINSLKPLGRKIMLVSHYPVDDDIQKMVDYYIYDEHNPLTHHSYYTRFYKYTDDYHAEININGLKNTNQSLTVLTNLFNGAKAAKSLGYDVFFYTTYDVVLDQRDIPQVEKAFDIDGKEPYMFKAYLASLNTPFGKGIQTNGMSFDIDFFLSTFDDVRTAEEYNNVCQNIGAQNFLEDYLIKKLSGLENKFYLEHNQEETLLKNSGLGVASNSEYYSIIPIVNSPGRFMFYFFTYNIDERNVKISIKESGEEFYNHKWQIDKTREFKKEFYYSGNEIEVELDFYDGDRIYKNEKYVLNDSTLHKFQHTGHYKKKNVKPKIRLVHLQTSRNDEREQKSRESLKEVSNYGWEYIIHTNEPYADLPPKYNCQRPQCVSMDLFDEQQVRELGTALTPSHYGCFESFKNGILSEFDSDVDYLIVCEGDCIIEVPIEEFIQKVEKSYQLLVDNNIGYMSFGDVKTLEHGWLQSPVREVVLDQDLLFITDHIIGLQCIGFPKFVKKWLFEKLRNQKWDAADMYFNHIFYGSPYKFGIVHNRITTQAEGFSLIDKQEKKFI